VTGITPRLVAAWYAPRPTLVCSLLRPFAALFGVVVALRRMLYRRGFLASERLGVPVVIVGNVTVGGAGKTPLALALAGALAARGRRPGFVSRGYGGSDAGPREVTAADDPRVVGDEPLLLAASGHPVWIGHRRAAAARGLVAAHPDVDVVIADDGLQHYALARDVEIAVVDAARGLGNGLMLPAGPLREPPSRLSEADAVVRLVAGAVAAAPAGDARESAMWLEAGEWRNLRDPARVAEPASWPRGSVHAIAGIGRPQRFFDTVRSLGIDAVCHPFADHHAYTPADLAFPGASAILMTAKDAVKCAAFADDRCWCLPVRAHLDPALTERVLARLHGRQAA
jgi:tetraacyldisaccharide 4'-kinase